MLKSANNDVLCALCAPPTCFFLKQTRALNPKYVDAPIPPTPGNNAAAASAAAPAT